MANDLDTVQACLDEMKASLLFAIADPFYYAHYGALLDRASSAVAHLKAPALAPPRNAPEPIVFTAMKKPTRTPRKGH